MYTYQASIMRDRIEILYEGEKYIYEGAFVSLYRGLIDRERDILTDDYKAGKVTHRYRCSECGARARREICYSCAGRKIHPDDAIRNRRVVQSGNARAVVMNSVFAIVGIDYRCEMDFYKIE